MLALYILICGLFWLGGNWDEASQTFFRIVWFIIQCFLEGWICVPMVLGKALLLWMENNQLK